MNALQTLSKAGSRVVEVRILSYIYDEAVDRVNPLAVYLRFTGDIDLTIRSASDGESIEYVGGLREFLPVEMGEFGRLIVEAPNNDPVLSKIVGEVVTSAFEIVSEKVVVGLKFIVGGDEVFFVNTGDQLSVFGEDAWTVNFPELGLKRVSLD